MGAVHPDAVCKLLLEDVMKGVTDDEKSKFKVANGGNKVSSWCCAVRAVLCYAVLCCAVLCCAVLCCAVLCCAVLCSAVLCVLLVQAAG
jgi:hypothetical protein